MQTSTSGPFSGTCKNATLGVTSELLISKGRRFGATPIFLSLAAASLLIPLFFLGIGGWLSYRNVVTNARVDLLHRLSIAEQQANDELDTDQLALGEVNAMLAPYNAQQVASHSQTLDVRLRALDDQFPQFNDLTVLGPEGQVLASSHSGSLPPKAVERRLLDRLRHGTISFYIGQAEPETGIGRYTFTVARPWQHAPGALDGAIIASVPAVYYRIFYRQLFSANLDYSGGLFRVGGTILAHYPEPAPSLLPVNKAPLKTTIARHPQGWIMHIRSPVDGQLQLAAYRKLQDYPAYVLVSRSWSSVLRQWRDLMLNYLWFGVPATAALFALSLAGLRRARGESAALAELRAEAGRRERAEQALRQSQKMEAVGRLTGGITHDFNNQITVIGSSLELIRKRLPQELESIDRLVGMAMQGVQGAASLTHRLLAFSRQQTLAPQPVDIGKLVANMSELLRRTLGEQVAIETVLAGGLWLTRIDSHQLENALLNLAVNARDAMPAGGRLTIETANAHLDDAYAAANAEVTAGQYVMIATSDTGTGMSAETIAKAFDPFYTTKPVGQGTGLGLSMVYGFVKHSGGHVKIYSEPDLGTTIKLYFPRLLQSGTTVTVAPKAMAALPHGSGQTVLFVEDDEAVRMATLEALDELGYTTLGAGSAEAALRLIHDHSDIALLFTDIGLPGAMNGRKLAETAAAMRSDLHVLLTTGYTRNAIIHNGTLDAGVCFLAKPFTLQALAEKLRSILTAVPGTGSEQN